MCRKNTSKSITSGTRSLRRHNQQVTRQSRLEKALYRSLKIRTPKFTKVQQGLVIVATSNDFTSEGVGVGVNKSLERACELQMSILHRTEAEGVFTVVSANLL